MLQTKKDYEIQIVKLLIKHLNAKTIEINDAGVISYLVEHSLNLESLKELLGLLQTEYPLLKEIIDKENSEIKENTEVLISRFVQKIIKDNPLLAAQVSVAAMEKGINIEILKGRFPELNKYI